MAKFEVLLFADFAASGSKKSGVYVVVTYSPSVQRGSTTCYLVFNPQCSMADGESQTSLAVLHPAVICNDPLLLPAAAACCCPGHWYGAYQHIANVWHHLWYFVSGHHYLTSSRYRIQARGSCLAGAGFISTILAASSSVCF